MIWAVSEILKVVSRHPVMFILTCGLGKHASQKINAQLSHVDWWYIIYNGIYIVWGSTARAGKVHESANGHWWGWRTVFLNVGIAQMIVHSKSEILRYHYILRLAYLRNILEMRCFFNMCFFRSLLSREDDPLDWLKLTDQSDIIRWYFWRTQLQQFCIDSFRMSPCLHVPISFMRRQLQNFSLEKGLGFPDHVLRSVTYSHFYSTLGWIEMYS